MGSHAAGLIALSIAWMAYGGLHSVLAAQVCKRRVAARLSGLVPAYRLLYNLFAGVALLPILWLLWQNPGPWLWRWHGAMAWVMNGLALVAAGVLLVGPGLYDLSEFLGLRQLHEGKHVPEDAEPFRIAPLHRYVRHPWYALSLALLWSRDMTAAIFVSALWITAYFIIGSRLEESKLLAQFGDRYREVQAPGAWPAAPSLEDPEPGRRPQARRRLRRETARTSEPSADMSSW